jgi:hypothetical protein
MTRRGNKPLSLGGEKMEKKACVNCRHCKFSRGNGLRHYYCKKKDVWMTDENAMRELDEIEYCEDYEEIEEGVDEILREALRRGEEEKWS